MLNGKTASNDDHFGLPGISKSETADLLRGRQIHAAEHNIRQAMMGSVAATALTCAFFYQTFGQLLLLWLVIVVLFVGCRIFAAHQIASKPPTPAPPRSIQTYILYAVLGSLVVTGLPTWLSMQTEGFTFAFMLALALGTFWSGAFVHGPLMPSAVAFMLTQLACAVAGALAAGMTWEKASMVTLFTFGTGAALHIVRQQSAVFTASVLQQIKIEHQLEVIGLLLREHEDQSSDWLWQTDANLHIFAPSDRFASIFPQLASTGSHKLDLLLDAGAIAGNTEAVEMLRKHQRLGNSFRDLVVPYVSEGTSIWFSLSGRPVLSADGTFTGYRGVMGDVTVAKVAEERLIRLANHDALTDLPNRTLFTSSLNRALGAGSKFVVLSVDLDGFKAVNDKYGHPAGDALLIETGRRLQAAVGPGNLVARLGGDEFIIQAWDAAPDAAETLCRTILAALAAPVHLPGADIVVGSSIGVAFAPSDGRSAEDLLKSVGAALYRAKHSGRGTFRFFSPEMDHQLQMRQALLHDLRTALAKGEFALHYQPFVHASTGAVTGCEALLRWYHPLRGLVSPAEFIPLAEDSGLIVSIGEWVIEEACREAASWLGSQRVSVNVSPIQFFDANLPTRIEEVLKRTGLPAERLEIEVTETVLVGDVATTIAMLNRIRAMGVRVALDDFGTGYSSLSYLRLFPFDKIKIDRSFVSDIEQRTDSQVIVRAIRDIAIGLGMTITAEGVETEAQAERLRATGCHEFQGFLFSRPQPSASLRPLLDLRLAA